MKRRIFSCIAAISLAAGMLSLPAFSAGEPLDYIPDGHVDVFDLIKAKRSGASVSEIKAVQNFLLGRSNGSSGSQYVPADYTVDESLILEPKGTVHTGDGTFYGGGYEGGCAMLDPVSRDYWIVAMNLADYNEGQLAGAYIEVTGELGTINMLVTDLLPEGKKGDLDLYTDAFPLIAPVEKGRVPVSWHIIPLDSAADAPVCYKYKEGTTEFWCEIQVRNHRYPITRLEYLDKNGEWVELPRHRYNYFESNKMGAGPFTFRITDIYGQQIIDRDIPLSYDDTEIIQGHVQFPE
ncbi:MAG: hypothetical protein IKO47_08060 [Ruminococcus sp.]|nr:hypothetical protein [Ruminococcus sp.]